MTKLFSVMTIYFGSFIYLIDSLESEAVFSYAILSFGIPTCKSFIWGICMKFQIKTISISISEIILRIVDYSFPSSLLSLIFCFLLLSIVQVHHTDQPQLKDPALIQLELGLVDVFISLCRFEWQTGYQEMATGLFQAEIEYSLFCPSLLLSEQSKQRLFEHFWNGNGARLGEDGAIGWSSWLEKEEESRQKAIIADSAQETEVGGWTGWSELPSRNTEISKEPEKLLEGDVGNEEIGDDLESEELKQDEEDVESMMKKLGINVDSEADSEVKDASTWKRWSEEESSRDSDQWMPVRESAGGCFCPFLLWISIFLLVPSS